MVAGNLVQFIPLLMALIESFLSVGWPLQFTGSEFELGSADAA
jgi:hypothetical protein